MSSSQPASTEFLTPEECAEVDKALMTSHDKFTTRVAIYALRSLKQIAQEQGVAIKQLAPLQVVEWVEQDESLQGRVDFNFQRFFAQLVISSMKPLQQAANDVGVTIEELSVAQVVAWFEKEAKRKLEQGR